MLSPQICCISANMLVAFLLACVHLSAGTLKLVDMRLVPSQSVSRPTEETVVYCVVLLRERKLMYRVVFPFELKLPNTTDDAAGRDALYSLFAVVVHVGSGPHHGEPFSNVCHAQPLVSVMLNLSAWASPAALGNPHCPPGLGCWAM